MAENRSITYNLTFAIDSKVTSAAKLLLQSDCLEWGKWDTSPPSEIIAEVGNNTTVSFEACGAQCTATGVQGSVVYKGTDADNTLFTLTFNVPYTAANSGNLTGGSEFYTTQGGNVPVTGNTVTVNVTINQVKPII